MKLLRVLRRGTTLKRQWSISLTLILHPPYRKTCTGFGTSDNVHWQLPSLRLECNYWLTELYLLSRLNWWNPFRSTFLFDDEVFCRKNFPNFTVWFHPISLCEKLRECLHRVGILTSYCPSAGIVHNNRIAFTIGSILGRHGVSD